jgi:hypothetical protein
MKKFEEEDMEEVVAKDDFRRKFMLQLGVSKESAATPKPKPKISNTFEGSRGRMK